MKTERGTWPCDHSSASRTSTSTAPDVSSSRASPTETSRTSVLTLRNSSLNVLKIPPPGAGEVRRGEDETLARDPVRRVETRIARNGVLQSARRRHGEDPRGQPRRLRGARPADVPGAGRTHGCARARAPGQRDEALLPRGAAGLRDLHGRVPEPRTHPRAARGSG